MFIKNNRYNEQTLYSPEQMLPERLQDYLKNHWSSIFFTEVFSKIKEEDFACLFCNNNGRPNTPINILAGLEILKEMFQLTDEVIYERFLFDMTFQRALGIEFIEDYFFSIRTLYTFRGRLAEYESAGNENPMMKVFKDGRNKIIEELGLKTGLQRTDSVMIGANIKRMNRLMLFHKVLSNLVRYLKKQDVVIEKEIEDYIKEDEDSIAYRLPSDRVQETIKKIAYCIHNLLEQYKNSEISLSDDYKKAQRLLTEQCTLSKENHFTKIALKEPKEISSGSMQNPADPDATYRIKRDEAHRGYSAHATETCDPSNPMQVITAVSLEKNNRDDAAVLNENMEKMKSETGLEKLITDGGFHSPDVSNSVEKLDIELVTTAIRGRQTEKTDILDTEAFKFEESGLIEACPVGYRPIKQTLNKEAETLTASFDKRNCSTCHQNSKCIAFLSEKQSRIVVDANRRWLDKNRRDVLNEEFIETCRLRPAVEGLMEKIKPKYLRGRTLFRTQVRVRNRLILRATALNFRRFVNLLDNLFRYIFQFALYSRKNELSPVGR